MNIFKKIGQFFKRLDTSKVMVDLCEVTEVLTRVAQELPAGKLKDRVEACLKKISGVCGVIRAAK